MLGIRYNLPEALVIIGNRGIIMVKELPGSRQQIII